MKTRRSDRLQLVVDLAQSAEAQAARNLGEAQKLFAAEQQRLDDINQYYASYEQLFAKRTNTLKASDIANSRDFLLNLDKACKQQQAQVKAAHEQVNEARDLWRQSHLKSDALEDFRQRCAQEEQKALEKKEQNQLDDLSSRKTLH